MVKFNKFKTVEINRIAVGHNTSAAKKNPNIDPLLVVWPSIGKILSCDVRYVSQPRYLGHWLAKGCLYEPS